MSNHFHILLEVPPMPEEGLGTAQELPRPIYLSFYQSPVLESPQIAGYDRQFRLGDW
jgi:hypothetical protein